MGKIFKKSYINLLKLYIYIVLAIIMVCFLLFYFWFYNNTIKMSSEKNNLILDIAKNDIDYRITNMTNIAKSFESDFDFVSAIIADEPNNKRVFTKKIKSYINMNAGIIDIVITDKHTDKAYNGRTITVYNQYFNKIEKQNNNNTLEYTNVDIKEFTDELWTITEPTFSGFYKMEILNRAISSDTLLYVFPLSPGRKVIFVLDKNLFFSSVDNILESQPGVFYISNPENIKLKIFYNNFSAEKSMDDIAALRGDNFTNKGYMVLSTRSSINPFWYSIQTPKNAFLDDLLVLKRNFIVSFIIITILGIVLTNIVGRKIYKPINELSENLKGTQNKLTGLLDIDTISMAFLDINKTIYKNKEVMDNSLISSLVITPAKYIFNKELYNNHNIYLDEKWLQASLIDLIIDNDDLKNRIQEICNHNQVACYISNNNEFNQKILVLNSKSKNKIVKSNVEISEMLEKSFEDFKMSVGMIVDKHYDLKLSFAQAISLYYDGESSHINYYNHDITKQVDNAFIKNITLKLKENILVGDIKKQTIILHEVFNSTTSSTKIQLMYSNILEFLFDLVEQHDLPSTLLLSAYFIDTNDSSIMLSTLLLIMASISEELTGINFLPKDDFVKEVYNYLNKNYKNSDLSIKDVADNFNISTTSLNNLTKATYGKTTFSILDNLRMEEAIHLLENTNISIKEVVNHSGYGDVNYFSKKFRKMAGMSPSEYRAFRQGN